MTALSRGQTPGPESSIIKVVAANKLQDILSYGLDMIGMAGPTMGDAMPVAGIFEEALLYSPALRLARRHRRNHEEHHRRTGARSAPGSAGRQGIAVPRHPDRSASMTLHNGNGHKLHSFFWPESIAVLGASPDSASYSRPAAAPAAGERVSRPHPADQSQLPGDRRTAVLPFDRCGLRRDRSGAGGDPRSRRGGGGGRMRSGGREKHADHQFGLRRRRRRRPASCRRNCWR